MPRPCAATTEDHSWRITLLKRPVKFSYSVLYLSLPGISLPFSSALSKALLDHCHLAFFIFLLAPLVFDLTR